MSGSPDVAVFLRCVHTKIFNNPRELISNFIRRSQWRRHRRCPPVGLVRYWVIVLAGYDTGYETPLPRSVSIFARSESIAFWFRCRFSVKGRLVEVLRNSALRL